MVHYQKVRCVYLFRFCRIRMKFSMLDITPKSDDNSLLATIIIRLDCVSYEPSQLCMKLGVANQNIMG